MCMRSEKLFGTINVYGKWEVIWCDNYVCSSFLIRIVIEWLTASTSFSIMNFHLRFLFSVIESIKKSFMKLIPNPVSRRNRPYVSVCIPLKFALVCSNRPVTLEILSVFFFLGVVLFSYLVRFGRELSSLLFWKFLWKNLFFVCPVHLYVCLPVCVCPLSVKNFTSHGELLGFQPCLWITWEDHISYFGL